MYTRYLQESFQQVYDAIGGNGMTCYYVPYIEKKFKNSQDFINYDFANKIKIKATVNMDLQGDPDLETVKKYLKTTVRSASIQFTVNSIYPNYVRMLDRIYIEYDDGRPSENFLIVGIDNDVLLLGAYVSVRAVKFDGTISRFQWGDNLEEKQ